MSNVPYTVKNHTYNLSTNSRAYELLQESKKDPNKAILLAKHLKEVSEAAKAVSKNTLTPVQYLGCLGFRVEDPKYFEQAAVVSRMDLSPIQESDKQRFNEALKMVSIRYPDFDLQELCRS